MSTPDLASARRYDTAVMHQARTLYEGGWNVTDITRILKREGVDPSPTFRTVKTWVDPTYYERRLEEDRRAKRRALAREMLSGCRFDLQLRGSSPEYRYARLKALADLGLGMTDVGKVMGIDFGEPLSREQVKRALDEGKWPKIYRKRAGKAA